jgi:type II secretory pathway pseudopilin PulG
MATTDPPGASWPAGRALATTLCLRPVALPSCRLVALLPSHPSVPPVCPSPCLRVAASPRRRVPASPRQRPSGVAALEAILLLAVVAAALALLAGQAESARNRLRQDLASSQLAILREALAVYYLDTGSFPPGKIDLSSRDAFKTMRALPACACALADWPQPAMADPDSGPVDPWRSAYRYIAPENDGTGQVADNGGWPLFVSAGPDGDFGDPADPAAEADNRRTDDLPAATAERR